MNDQLKKFLKDSVGYALIALISGLYVLTAFLDIGMTHKSLFQIIADSMIAFMLGLFLNRAFEYQGLVEGDRDPRMIAALEKHVSMVDQIAPYIDRLETWCDRKNTEAMRIQRTRVLAEWGMRYADYFDEEGMVKEYGVDENGRTQGFAVNQALLENRYTKRGEIKRIKCYYKALGLKLTPLTATVLISEGGRYDDPFWLGRTKPEYTSQSGRSDMVTKVVLSLLFGYFGVSLIGDFSWANLIWKVLQVGMFLICGVLKKYQSAQFVMGEYCGRINKKIYHLQIFACEENISIAVKSAKEENTNDNREAE